MLNNENGQATTAALILLPVALALFCAFLIFAKAFVLEANATAACRVSMAQSQNEAAGALNQLLALNPTAETLESNRRAAKVALAVAEISLNPAAIAAAATALETIEIAQIPVIARQKLLFAKGWLASTRVPGLAQSSLRQKIPTQFLAAFPESFGVPRFHVITSPPGARTPTYQPAPGFNKSQESRVRWLLKLETAVDVGCAMTLEKKGDGKWAPQMTEDKLLRN